MEISDELAGVLERNCGEIKLERNKDGSTSLSFTFEPDLRGDSEDGRIFIDEVKKMLNHCEYGEEEDEDVD